MSKINIPSVSEVKLDPTLLTYLVATEPAPLQTSTVYTPTTGTINVSVFNPSNAWCKEIDIAFPIGATDDALFTVIPTLAVNTPHWVASTAMLLSGRALGLDTDTQYATFYLTCPDANYFQINYNFVISVQGPVNQLPGDASSVLVQEISSAIGSPYKWQTLPYKFPLTKGLPNFYVNNFISARTANPTVPSSEFTNGTDILLAWESNGSFFQLYKKGVTTPIYAGVKTTFTVTGGVPTDTTFILVASMTGNPSTDPIPPQAGYTPIYIYESLTVTVSNPILTPASVTAAGAVSAATLAVSGAAGLNGNTTVGGSLAVAASTTLAATSAGALTVTGQTTLAGATATSLNVSGGATVGGLLSASANATVGGLLTAGSATINGLLRSIGSVSMLGVPQSISPKTYTSPTDGFAVGYVGTPGDNTKICRTLIFGSAPGVQATAQGGNYTAFFRWSGSSGTAWLGGLQNSFCMPVQKGVNFSVSFWNDGNNEANAPTYFYWVPLGAGNVGNLEVVGDAVPFMPVEEASSIVQIASRAPDMHDLDISDLMSVMDEILGAYMNDAQRSKLQEAVRRIVYFETRDLR